MKQLFDEFFACFFQNSRKSLYQERMMVDFTIILQDVV